MPSSVGIVEFDDLIADMVGGAVEWLAHGFFEPIAQRCPAGLTVADAHVFGEQVHPCVRVAHVQS
jgi:hypothetical protein